ncbi:MAG: DUF4276 family protein [Flavobacteriales bacterium]|nr:DUF4276 family protein [Flavobacteriales bacterium]
MIRAIYIICEGPTEEEFVNKLLRPFFYNNHIFDVRPILMNTSKGQKGGDVKYDRLKHNIDKLLKRETDILVSTFIDFFRLVNDFPKFGEAKAIQNKIQRVDFLENALTIAINHPRFVPYIQLHEFEGLLFASKDGFEFLPDIKQASLKSLLLAVNEKENPEELNDGELTVPSKRLEQLIPGYRKTFHGPLIAEINEIEVLLTRCLRFKNWVQTLIEKANQ